MSNSSQRDMFSGLEGATTRKPLVLWIAGLIPGKKNNKMLVVKDPRGRPLRRPMLITKPEYQRALDEIILSLQCQCLSVFQTEGGETLTASQRQSWIASSLPEDDCWTHIPTLTIQAELCEAGEEGARITVQRLD